MYICLTRLTIKCEILLWKWKMWILEVELVLKEMACVYFYIEICTIIGRIMNVKAKYCRKNRGKYVFKNSRKLKNLSNADKTLICCICRSSHRRCSVWKGVLRSFAKFLLLNVYLWYFLNKVKKYLQLIFSLDKYSMEWQVIQKTYFWWLCLHAWFYRGKESIQEENNSINVKIFSLICSVLIIQ